ncbi:MAG: ComEC/Rec2 family competence protein, partial [Brevinematia bacterium]
MYYLIFILFAYLLFNNFLWFSISIFLFLIIFLFFKKEKSFIFLFVFGAILLFFNYFNNINFNYINHNEKFINGDFLINDFSEISKDKKVVSAFPFEIFYENDLNLYRGQIVEVAGYKYKNKIYVTEIIVKKEGNFIFHFFSNIRQKLYSRLGDSNFKSLVESFIFGDKNSLDFETRENFKITGLMHLLALSGLHIGIIAGFLSFLLSFFLRKSLVFYFVSFFLILYVFLSGFSPSVFRAAFMFIILYYYTFFESL